MLIFVYFMLYPERAPKIFSREPKGDKEDRCETEEDEDADGACKPSSGLIRQRNDLVKAINAM